MWARSGLKSCIECDTKVIPHEAKGFCKFCYQKERNSLRKNRIRIKKTQKSYYLRIKNNLIYIKRTREASKKWKHGRPPSLIGSWYRGEQRRRLKFFLEKGRNLKAYITIICSCCRKECIAPFRKRDLPNKEPWLMLFRKMLIEKHKQNSCYNPHSTLKEE